MRYRIVTLAALLIAGPLAAQRARTPLVADLAGSTRGLAMGGTLVGGREDDVIFLNPAQLAAARGMSAQAQRFGSASTLLGLSAAMASGRWSFGVGMLSVSANVGREHRFDPTAIAVAGGDLVESRAAVIGVARTFFGMRFGVAAKHLMEHDFEVRRGWTVADVGVSRDMLRGTAALSVQNIGAEGEWGSTGTEHPLMATLGFNIGPWPVAKYLDLALAAATRWDADGRITPAGGVEANVVWLEGYALSLRGGIRRPATGSQGAATAGLGFTRDNVSVDYAFEPGRGVPHAHRVGIRVR